MTNNPLSEDEIRQEEMRLLIEEMEEDERELELAHQRLKDLLDVLEAVLIAKHTGTGPSLPDLDLFADDLMKWLALSDPLFFDVALEREANACDEELADLPFVAKLLRAKHRPNSRSRTGDNLGRDLLILAAMQALEEMGEGRRKKNKPSADASAQSLAEALSDRLNQMEHLGQSPDIAPGTDRLRQVWLSRQEFIARAKPPAPISEIGWAWLD